MRSLLEQGHRFTFFRVVQLLEMCHPDAPRLGTGGPARQEAVRLRPDASFTVPRTTVSRIEEAAAEGGRRRFVVTQTVMGLYGIRSPMPEIYGEEILRRQHESDAVRDFLDLFHHRLLSLLYRAWARSRAHVTFRHGGEDALTRIVFSIGGFAEEASRRAAHVAPLGLLRYTPFLSRASRPAEGLATILADFLGAAAVRVEPYVPRPVVIPEEQRSRLGVSGCTLGEDWSLGERIEDRGGKFRLWIGPLARPDFLALAPGGEARAGAGALVRLYLLDPLEHDVMLGIVAREKPALRLGADETGPRLGIDTWLYTEEPRDSWVLFMGLPAHPDSTPDQAAGSAPAPLEDLAA